MNYIGIGILLIFLMLALISRKNFSKYKEVKGGPLANICYSIAKTVTQGAIWNGVKVKIKSYLRKLYPIREEELIKQAEEYLIKTIVIIPISLLVLGIILFLFSFLSEKSGNVIKRNPYGGMEKIYQVEITEGGSRKKYKLEVYPQEYKYEDFCRLADEAFDYIDQLMSGDNPDLNHVTKDLIFPIWDESKTLRIKWQTDYATIINSSGYINNMGMEKDEKIHITAVVEDGSFEKIYQWDVIVLAPDTVLEGTDRAAEALKNLEQETRTDEDFVVPEKIGNAEIRLNRVTNIKMICKLFLVAIIFSGICIYLRYYRLKEDCRRRNEYLSSMYFRIIDKLVLLLGSGMTVRNSLTHIFHHLFWAQESNALSNLLKAEIQMCLNELESGTTESEAYSALGNRIGLPEYMRLFSLIGQNVNHGNSNLLELLETEARDAMLKKKEYARKKGEEASGKLLIPMFILMITVIGIVMFPALSGM